MSIRNQGLQGDQVALLGAALAVVVSVTTADGKFDWFDTIAGVIAFLILNSFHIQDDRSLFDRSLRSWSHRTIWFQKAVFGAVWALCVIVCFGVLLDRLGLSLYIFPIWLVIAVGCIIVREVIIVVNKRRTSQPAVSPPSVTAPPVSNTQTGKP